MHMLFNTEYPNGYQILPREDLCADESCGQECAKSSEAIVANEELVKVERPSRGLQRITDQAALGSYRCLVTSMPVVYVLCIDAASILSHQISIRGQHVGFKHPKGEGRGPPKATGIEKPRKFTGYCCLMSSFLFGIVKDTYCCLMSPFPVGIVNDTFFGCTGWCSHILYVGTHERIRTAAM